MTSGIWGVANASVVVGVGFTRRHRADVGIGGSIAGAGTTTTAARAGAPQVVVPQIADQPYWAGRGDGAAVPGETSDRSGEIGDATRVITLTSDRT